MGEVDGRKMRPVRKSVHLTPVKVRSRIEKYRDRYRAAGLVQINVWVPEERRAEILRELARERVEHLSRVGHYESRYDDE